MTHLIDKDALVAELKKRFDYRVNGLKAINNGTFWDEEQSEDTFNVALTTCAYNAVKNELFELKCFLDIVEVKEVDLENELNDFIEEQKAWVKDDRVVEYDNGDSFNHIYDLESIAKHFFELGLKAQTDAFNDKAVEYIANNMRCDGYTLQTKATFIKGFKDYMKGE